MASGAVLRASRCLSMGLARLRCRWASSCPLMARSKKRTREVGRARVFQESPYELPFNFSTSCYS
eukprot:4538108-Alexandrium_andersonii.AAC.1